MYYHTENVYPPISEGKTSDHMSTTQKPSFICSVRPLIMSNIPTRDVVQKYAMSTNV